MKKKEPITGIITTAHYFQSGDGRKSDWTFSEIHMQYKGEKKRPYEFLMLEDRNRDKTVFLFFEDKKLNKIYWQYGHKFSPSEKEEAFVYSKARPVSPKFLEDIEGVIEHHAKYTDEEYAKLGEVKTNPLKTMPTSDLAKHVATIEDSQEAIRVVQNYFNQKDGDNAGLYFSEWNDETLQAHWDLLKPEDRSRFMKGYIQDEFDNLDKKKYISEELNKNFPEHMPAGSADWGGIRHWKVDDNDGITGMFILIDDEDNVILMSRSLTRDEEDYVDEDIAQVDNYENELVMKLEELMVKAITLADEADFPSSQAEENEKSTKELETKEEFVKAQVPEDEEIASKWIVETVQFRSVKVGDYLADGPNAREISKLIGINGNKSKLQRVWSSDERVPVGEIFYLDGYLASDDEENILNRVTNFEDFRNSKTGKVQQSSALTPDEIVYLKLVMSGRNSSIEISIMDKLEQMYNQAAR